MRPEKSNYRHRRLLRPRRKRPHGSRAAEQRDELASPNAKCHVIPPAEG